MLFNSQVSVESLWFLLLLVSNFIALWLRNIHDIVLIHLYSSKQILWAIIQSILEKVPCVAKNNLYSVCVGWNILLVCFCVFLYGWYVYLRCEVLNLPYKIVLMFIWSFLSNSLFYKFGLAGIWCIYIHNHYLLLNCSII